MTSVATKPQAASKTTMLVPEADLKDIMALDAASKAANAQLIQASIDGNEMAKAIILSRAVQTLRSLMTDKIMDDVMLLMNSPLGFKTDRPPGAKDKEGRDIPLYNKHQVRDVMVQALIRGFRFTGNEINIIAGQFYGTKEGYERLLDDLPGLTDLRVDVGVPRWWALALSSTARHRGSFTARLASSSARASTRSL